MPDLSTKAQFAHLLNKLKGCPSCEYDEEEGGLFRHCANCQLAVTTIAYELFIGPEHKTLKSALQKFLVDSRRPPESLVTTLTRLLYYQQFGEPTFESEQWKLDQNELLPERMRYAYLNDAVFHAKVMRAAMIISETLVKP